MCGRNSNAMLTLLILTTVLVSWTAQFAEAADRYAVVEYSAPKDGSHGCKLREEYMSQGLSLLPKMRSGSFTGYLVQTYDSPSNVTRFPSSAPILIGIEPAIISPMPGSTVFAKMQSQGHRCALWIAMRPLCNAWQDDRSCLGSFELQSLFLLDVFLHEQAQGAQLLRSGWLTELK